jgi:DNA-binding protein Fis
MKNGKNSILLESVLKSLYTIASRRTSIRMANETIGSSIKTLENKYDFLKFVNTGRTKSISQSDFAVSVSPEINTVSPKGIGKAIEALIRVVYNDLGNEAGLYFITEFKEHTGEQITRMINKLDVDLDQIQLEQHYAFRRQERKKQIQKMASTGRLGSKQPDNLLGYTWDSVSSWRHEPGNKYCTLYDKQGKIIDRLNLDQIIQNYVEKLSGYIDVDTYEIERETELYEKEYKLLKMMLERDMDTETAQHMLNVSRNELNNMIKKLSEMEMLQFISFDTIEITETGIGFINKKEKDKEN